MPSERLQINVRATPDTYRRFLALIPRVQAAMSLELSQAEVIRLAILELEKKYPPPADDSPPDPRPTKGRPRKKE